MRNDQDLVELQMNYGLWRSEPAKDMCATVLKVCILKKPGLFGVNKIRPLWVCRVNNN